MSVTDKSPDFPSDDAPIPAQQPRRITSNDPAQFPCWLWCSNGFMCPDGRPGWIHPDEFEFTRAIYHSSHWHPNQPEAPTVRPDKRELNEAKTELEIRTRQRDYWQNERNVLRAQCEAMVNEREQLCWLLMRVSLQELERILPNWDEETLGEAINAAYLSEHERVKS